MTTSNIVIRGTSVYHPRHVLSNDYFVEKFRKQGQEIENLLKVLGRESRHLSPDPNENTLTMGIQVAKQLLKQEELKGKDIDMLVFASGIHEYHVPPDSCLLHEAIQGKHECVVYDINVNCVGMVVAVDQVYRYMKTNPSIRYAMVVGSERMIQFTNETDALNYSNFGDASCAVILERTDEENRGFIDSRYYTESNMAQKMKLPSCGMSKIYDPNIPVEFKKIQMAPDYNSLLIAPSAVENIQLMSKKQGIEVDNIQMFFISQLTTKIINYMAEHLGVPIEKFEFIGNRYGYTGVSSPFIALHHAVMEAKLKRGDWFVLWSAGAGASSCAIFGRY